MVQAEGGGVGRGRRLWGRVDGVGGARGSPKGGGGAS
jgi:hypothetical protein